MANPDQLIQAVCDTAERSAPAGWRRIVLRVWASVVVQQVELTVVLADGSSPATQPPEVTDLISELRMAMYLPARGTWLSAWFELRAGEPPEAGFNLDQDPAWFPELPPIAFARDLDVFPRSDEHIPVWLRQTLADAEAMAPRPGD
ncbi:hypothetical protein [Amycolatopsis sp. lyj-112]|uniref:hypothetical protein n=1 Tax=Amycolatopsis sp. lyj-112 TaxID=2789288 RepID=UPI00397DD47A